MLSPQHKQYLRTQIQTASKEQLVLMLFDGAIRFCEQGRRSLENQELEPAHVALTRAQEIIMELLYAVDREKGGELGENLIRLYSYSLICLVEANMKQNPSKAEEVQRIMRQLREGWVGAMDKLKGEAPPPAPDPAATIPPENPGPAGLATGDVIALSGDKADSALAASAPQAGNQTAHTSQPAPAAKPRPPKLPRLAPNPGLQPRLSVQG